MNNPKKPPYRSPDFLQWAKYQYGPCCICLDNPGAELHHYGPKGMGQKASDLLVARTCKRCHIAIQGKRRIAFERLNYMGRWADILEDSIALLAGYVEYLEGKKWELN